ncbi:hypothetical protein RhiirC2_718750 [Rhizophagus irregularis]|uniref:Uncharacterized protein n=1 Tax=Rhizophagus irregularis TaxID=588596 RepID=A0A2N1MH53_9GLOM|nr:hypothetical protein RhiirC2_718750 [Rhizophagus irregularis]
MNEENIIIQELGGKMLSPVDDIGVIFRYGSKNIRIIVQPPPPATTTVPSTRTISLAQIEKEVQDLFKIHPQDLEKVATNKYDPYVYFEAPYDHLTSEIDKKKIPMLGGDPNLLLYNLPRKNKDYLTAEKLKCEMEPKSWLIFQLSHQLINLLPVKFRDIVDEEALKEYRLNIIKSIDNKIKTIFPIIYDEAQYHTSYLSNTFLSYNDKNKKRPLFTIIMKIFSDLSSIFPKAIVCITGSGLSLMEAKDLAISNVAKTETAIPIFKNFGQIQTSEEILELARNIFPLEDKYASMAIEWLKFY